MRISEDVLYTKIKWFDPYMRGDFVESDEIQDRHLKKKPAKILYDEDEMKTISEEARSHYLFSDKDLEILKTKVAKYGRVLKAVPIDGDCLLHAIRDQCAINPQWTIMENRQTVAFYLAKLPEQFYLYSEPYCLDQSFESYVLNFYRGYSQGDELIAGVWGHVWNMKITIVSPETPDLKIFHDDDDFPDVVIVHNGRAAPEGHYFSTRMHDRRSKKLPIYGDNHSYKITELMDVKHHSKLAERHYKEVKQEQCIHDYNSAVDDLSALYDKIMQAKEEEMELDEAMKKAKAARVGMEKCISAGTDRLILAKAKLQVLGVSASSLNKVKPVSQGTQVDPPDDDLQPIVSIPEDESDKALRALLDSEKTSAGGLSVLEGASQNYAGILPEGTIAAPIRSVTRRTTSTAVKSSSSLVPVAQEIQIIAEENPQLDVPIVLNVGKEVEVVALEGDDEEEKIPPGYKATKYENTLEKIDLAKPTEGQKAPKRFFCLKCMLKKVETGYTKRNDLVHHLEKCGEPVERKYVCTWKDCSKSFMRASNLRQHVARDHTKEVLYTCKKCGKGFFTSPEATAHRKLCYPKGIVNNPEEDINEEEQEEEREKDKEKDKEIGDKEKKGDGDGEQGGDGNNGKGDADDE